jgi:hypothetical protein
MAQTSDVETRREIAKLYLESLELDSSRGCLTFESDLRLRY